MVAIISLFIHEYRCSKAMLMILIFLDSLNKYLLRSVQQIWQCHMTFGHLSVALYAEELNIKSFSIFFVKNHTMINN